MPNLTTIKNTLNGLKPGLLQKYPIASIGLFGSVVRNDFTIDSDIDIIVDFNKPIGIDFITLADELEAKLNCKVDLVSKGGIKPKYFKAIESEIVYV
jgi:predicted nucleotidyltransferase